MEYTVSSSISLLSHIHSATADFIQQQLCEKGLTSLASSHGFILFCLSKNDMLPLGALAEKINRDKSTTTVLVRKLAKAGLVTVEKCSSDSRKKFVQLTGQGRAYNEVMAHISKELLATCYAGFSEAEKESFTAFLLRINENIQTGLSKAQGVTNHED